MSAELEQLGFACFLVFCRAGACLMLVAGFASLRVPPMMRLLGVIGVSLALAPLALIPVGGALARITTGDWPLLIVSEIATGTALGLLCRLYLAALQFAATYAANAIGLAGIPGAAIDEPEPASPLTSLVSLGGTVAVFAADLHLEVIRTLMRSYTVLPPAPAIDWGRANEDLLSGLSETSLLALRLSAPFIIYAVTVNLALGLVNRFTPQISVYFASLGIVSAIGLLLIWAVADEWLLIFTGEYARFLGDL